MSTSRSDGPVHFVLAKGATLSACGRDLVECPHTYDRAEATCAMCIQILSDANLHALVPPTRARIAGKNKGLDL